MSEMTIERRNDIIWNMTSGYYSFNSNTTVGTIAKNASRMVVDNYPMLFGDNYEAAKQYIADKDMTTQYIEKEDGKYPARNAGDIIEAATSVVKEELSKFFIDLTIPAEESKEEVKVEEKTEEAPVQEVKVDIASEDSNVNMAKIDFGFGQPFDPDQINKEMAEQFDPSNPARAFLQQPTEFQQPVTQVVPEQPYFVQTQPIPMMYQQPVIHKVDEAPKPKKQVPEEDNVEHNLETIQINDLKKPPVVKQTPEIVHPLENVPPTPTTVSNIYDNTAIANKFTKIPLLEIQAIANNNGCSVEYAEYPHDGIISVAVFDHIANQPVAPKSFCIDTGMIIDKRVKVIGTNPVFNQEVMLEQAPMYELFTNAPNGNKKVLDTKLINDIFVAGLLNVTKKEMYSDAYKALNMKLALITLPTKGLNKEERNSLQDYVVKMDQDGYLDKAIQMAPGSRFVFTTPQLKKNALADFILINQGVPRFYGTDPLNVIPVIIESKSGKIAIRTAGQQ